MWFCNVLNIMTNMISEQLFYQNIGKIAQIYRKSNIF